MRFELLENLLNLIYFPRKGKPTQFFGLHFTAPIPWRIPVANMHYIET